MEPNKIDDKTLIYQDGLSNIFVRVMQYIQEYLIQPTEQADYSDNLNYLRLLSVYNQYDCPTRHYHTKEHLHRSWEYILSLDLPNKRRVATICLALLYHDAIYLSHTFDGVNERLSAQLFLYHFSDICSEDRFKIYDAIISTRNHIVVVPDGIKELVIEADLIDMLQLNPGQIQQNLINLWKETNCQLAWKEFIDKNIEFVKSYENIIGKNNLKLYIEIATVCKETISPDSYC